MQKVYVVTVKSFSPCYGDCGDREYTSISFVTFDKNQAESFVKEKNSNRKSAWASEYDFEEFLVVV